MTRFVLCYVSKETSLRVSTEGEDRWTRCRERQRRRRQSRRRWTSVTWSREHRWRDLAPPGNWLPLTVRFSWTFISYKNVANLDYTEYGVIYYFFVYHIKDFALIKLMLWILDVYIFKIATNLLWVTNKVWYI